MSDDEAKAWSPVANRRLWLTGTDDKIDLAVYPLGSFEVRLSDDLRARGANAAVTPDGRFLMVVVPTS